MIKAITKEQLPAYLEIIKQSYENTAIKFGMTEENCPFRGRTRLPYEIFENEFNDGYLMYGYLHNDEMIGFLSLSVKEQEMHINDIAALPMWQSNDFGSKLMQFAINKATELNCYKLVLGMVHDNIALRDWYNKIGFKTVELIQFEKVSYTVGKMQLLL